MFSENCYLESETSVKRNEQEEEEEKPFALQRLLASGRSNGDDIYYFKFDFLLNIASRIDKFRR